MISLRLVSTRDMLAPRSQIFGHFFQCQAQEIWFIILLPLKF